MKAPAAAKTGATRSTHTPDRAARREPAAAAAGRARPSAAMAPVFFNEDVPMPAARAKTSAESHVTAGDAWRTYPL